MVSKMLALYPPTDSTEMTAEALVEELREIPWRWVQLAFRRLVDESGRKWMPTISEIKTKLAYLLREERRRRGEHVEPGLAIEAELTWLRERVDSDLRSGKLPPGVTSKQIAAQAAEWLTS